MSTRSNIAILQEDGKVKSIYVHFDGYPSGVGKNLFNHYKDKSKVEELINLGDCSAVYENVKPTEGEAHSYERTAKNVTIAYGRDRKEYDTDAQEIDSLQNYKPDNDYAYLFKENKWYVCEPYRNYNWQELTEEIIKSGSI